MILVISNWKRKMLYLICAAVAIMALALIFSLGVQEEPVDLPLIEEESSGKEFDGGVEKVIKEKLEKVNNENDNLKQNCNDLNCEEKSNETDEKIKSDIKNKENDSWLKSLIDKFKKEE